MFSFEMDGFWEEKEEMCTYWKSAGFFLGGGNLAFKLKLIRT